MKTERSILVAFLLNAAFSVVEFVGGMLTGSIAIASDAVHDLGDATSIGLSYFLEKKSKRRPDGRNTYGYARYSVLAGAITSLILLLGSLFVIYNAIQRIINPVPIHYDGMLIFAILGICVNLGAALLTGEGKSLGQKAVSLHMLEDVLGWAAVLVGAVVIRLTDLVIFDPILSICVAAFILVSVCRGVGEILRVFLDKTPADLCPDELRAHLLELEDVQDVHHIHVWSLDGRRHLATMHVVTDADPHAVKHAVREELAELGIVHATLELETSAEHCHEQECCPPEPAGGHHHHHHHHHH